jgi:hypothetical protein
MSNVNWIKWEDQKPEYAGMYLTYWSDKSLESYSIGADEIDEPIVMVQEAELLYWANNPEPPIIEE